MYPDSWEIAQYLSGRERAVSAAAFPTGVESLTSRPGLYSWWVDDAGRSTLENSIGAELTDLIYVGQAGAASSRSRKPSAATLGSRIGQNHLNGTAHGSTFRKSVTALLLQPLGLTVEKPDRLQAADRHRVSDWMRAHLSVVVFPYNDRLSLGALENEVTSLLDPPLNLQGVPSNALRKRLSELRRLVSHPEVQDTSMLAGEVRTLRRTVSYMIPTVGPDGWRSLLADPALHWVRGRSARTLAHSWEEAAGWPPEVARLLSTNEELARFEPVYAFPEFKTPLPGGRRESQTDLLVIASNGSELMTMAVEGKVDESFGPVVADWLGPNASPGKQERLAYLTSKLRVETSQLASMRYQLLHRTVAAKVEAERIGSSTVVMLVHSWGGSGEGFQDFHAFASVLGVEADIGGIGFSRDSAVWLGWVAGDPRYLEY